MKDVLSRRMFMKSTGALAAGAWAGVPSSGTAAQTVLPRAARPENEMTAGMIDFHVHTAPDTADRTVNAIEAARTARDRGLRAIVLKGTAFETVTRASQAAAEVKGIQVFGGVVLNSSCAKIQSMVDRSTIGAFDAVARLAPREPGPRDRDGTEPRTLESA